jgi:hypothetical protein
MKRTRNICLDASIRQRAMRRRVSVRSLVHSTASALRTSRSLALWARTIVCLGAMVFLPFSTSVSRGQYGNGQQTTTKGFPSVVIPTEKPNPNGSLDQPDNPFANEKQIEAFNKERQKQMLSDSAKLLKLATELKSDVDKSGKETLSLDDLRKAEQIEKLARSVREKMRSANNPNQPTGPFRNLERPL